MKKYVLIITILSLVMISCGESEKADVKTDSTEVKNDSIEKQLLFTPPVEKPEKIAAPVPADTVTPLPAESEKSGPFDAEKIFDEYLKLAGQDKISQMKTIKSSGTITQNNINSKFVRIQKKPDKSYLEMESQGQKMIQSYDGQKAWMYTPSMGPEPQEITGTQLQMIKEQASTDMFIQDWKKMGVRIEAAGIEMLNGKKVYKIKAFQEGGQEMYLYIDVKTKLLVMIRANISYQGNNMTAETFYKNYRTIKGIKIPFLIENTADGVVMSKFMIDKFELNVSVDDAVFGKPTIK